MQTFQNRVALITGAASGLGRQLALTLARQGALIAGVDRQAEGLAQLEAELPGPGKATALADVTDPASLHQAVKQLETRLGPVDLLIASAGIGKETSALNYHAATIEEIIKINLVGVVHSVDAVLPGMLERKRGHLVAISSVASFRGFPRMAGYCASKAGVNALFDSLRIELKPLGIDVTTICPCWVRTPMTANLQIPTPDILEVEDAAQQIVQALKRRDPFFAFPAKAASRARLAGMLPSRLSDWLVSRLMKDYDRK
jgi:short-subunit dehydrogenase